EGVGDRHDRLAEVGVGHAGGAPQGARAGHVAARGGGRGAESRHAPSVGGRRRWDRHGSRAGTTLPRPDPLRPDQPRPRRGGPMSDQQPDPRGPALFLVLLLIVGLLVVSWGAGQGSSRGSGTRGAGIAPEAEETTPVPSFG